MKIAVTCLSLILLSSCMLGPKKELPEVAIPSTYTEKENAPISLGEEVSLKQWWKQFNDPILDELVEACLEKNFDIRTVTEQINKVRSSLTTANAKLLPFIEFFGSPARIKTPSNISPTLSGVSPVAGSLPSIRSLFVLGFDASWELDFFGKNLSNKEEAFFNWRASQESAKYVKLVVIAEVVRLYTEIRGLQQRILLTEKKVQVYENLLKLTVTLGETGLKSAIPIENKVASLSATKSLIPDLRKALDQSISSLAFLLGGEISQYQDKLEKAGRLPQAIGKVPVGLPSELIERRPDIKEAQYKLFASGSAIGAAKADLLPSFSLTGIIGNSAKAAGSLFKSASRYWAVFPDFDWGIFQGGSVLAKIEMANSDQKQAAISYEKTVFNALKEVENALISYQESSLKTEDILTEYKAKKAILLLSESLFKTGLSSLFDLLEAYDSLFTVQTLQVESKEQTMLGLISLYKSLGGDL
jgi:outer membrane protein, multidrug efflux system